MNESSPAFSQSLDITDDLCSITKNLHITDFQHIDGGVSSQNCPSHVVKPSNMTAFIEHCQVIQRTLIDILRHMSVKNVDDTTQGCIMESRLQDKLRNTWKIFVSQDDNSSQFVFSSGYIMGDSSPQSPLEISKDEKDGLSDECKSKNNKNNGGLGKQGGPSAQTDIILYQDSPSQMFVSVDSVAGTCECKLTIKQKSNLEAADNQIRDSFHFDDRTQRFDTILVAFQLYHQTNHSSPILNTITRSWIPSLKAAQNFFVFYNDVKTYKEWGPYGIFSLRRGAALADALATSSALPSSIEYMVGIITPETCHLAYFVFMTIFLSFFYAARQRLNSTLKLNFDMDLNKLYQPCLILKASKK